MIATGVFLLLFLTFLSCMGKRRWVTVGFFAVSMISILLLFSHHVTDALEISL